MNTRLTHHQQSFIDSFLSPTAVGRQVLCAAPGMGKTTTALELIEQFYQSNSTSKILFLGPTPACSQAADILQNRVSSSDSFYFSRQRIRELAITSAAIEWPTRIVIVPYTIANQPDVLASLRSTDWGLIVVDEADKSVRLVESLTAPTTRARILLLASLDARDAAVKMFDQFQVTQWAEEELNAADASTRLLNYHRSMAERKVMEGVERLATELKETGTARAFGQTIRQAAMSSFNALEQLLTRQLGILNDPTSASNLGGLPEDFATQEFDLALLSPWKDRTTAAEKLLSVLEAIAKTPADEKLAALLLLIEDIAHRRPNYRLWIVTSFRATAWYLKSSLSERGLEVNVLTADMSYSRALEASGLLDREHSQRDCSFLGLQMLSYMISRARTVRCI
jgi:hypothetical protein